MAQLTDKQLSRLWGKKIGFVFQSYRLIPTLSAEENVRVPLEMFRDRGARCIGAEYECETRQNLVAGGKGFLDDPWSQYAQLGWLAAPLAEDCGGLGGRAVAVALVMEQMGRAL